MVNFGYNSLITSISLAHALSFLFFGDFVVLFFHFTLGLILFGSHRWGMKETAFKRVLRGESSRMELQILFWRVQAFRRLPPLPFLPLCPDSKSCLSGSFWGLARVRFFCWCLVATKRYSGIRDSYRWSFSLERQGGQQIRARKAAP